MRCRDDDFGVRLRHTADLSHRPQNIGLVLEKVGEVDPARAVVFERPREMPQVAEHVGARAGLPVQADGCGILFLLSAPDVENEHGEKR